MTDEEKLSEQNLKIIEGCLRELVTTIVKMHLASKLYETPHKEAELSEKGGAA